jgi:hypothetical protein
MPTFGYTFTRDDLAQLVIGMQFPERTRWESALLTHFLLAHGLEYDGYQVSVRVGQGRPADPSHDPAIQQQTVEGSKLRIDLLAHIGNQPYIYEVKRRANHHAIGQLLTYQHLYAEDHPDEPPARLGVIAATIDPDLERVFLAQGIPVYLYTDEDTGGGAPARGVRASDAPAA